MRDPDSSLTFEDTGVVRTFTKALADRDFLVSAVAREWVDQGQMVPFELLDDHRMRAPRMPFVTQPDEWCDAQLWDAAQLTLSLQTQAVASGFDLKDASAWNVLFSGCLPLLCDHGSPTPLQQRTWWAGGQFARQFLLPLLLARTRGLHAHQSFALWRDGVPPTVAARLIGPRRYLTRYWPLMAGAGRPARSGPTPGPEAGPPNDLKVVQRFRDGLHASFDFMLKGLRAAAQAPTNGSNWSRYTDERAHYEGETSAAKRRQVADWLARIQPGWTADLGCNTGEYSELALAADSRVVAVDSDHDCVQALYLRQRSSNRLYPVIASLDDLSGGRGWCGSEHDGVATRMQGAFDLVMMLALVHHLAVGAAVPLARIGEFAARLSRRWLIVEFLAPADRQLRQMCAERQRNPDDFSVQAQRDAFEAAGFELRGALELAQANRTLALMERRQP